MKWPLARKVSIHLVNCSNVRAASAASWRLSRSTPPNIIMYLPMGSLSLRPGTIEGTPDRHSTIHFFPRILMSIRRGGERSWGVREINEPGPTQEAQQGESSCNHG